MDDGMSREKVMNDSVNLYSENTEKNIPVVFVTKDMISLSYSTTILRKNNPLYVWFLYYVKQIRFLTPLLTEPIRNAYYHLPMEKAQKQFLYRLHRSHKHSVSYRTHQEHTP